MIWNNLWGWFGLVTLAIPILVHAFGRERAREQPFPTLAFIRASRLSPKRRRRLSDVPLLLVRLAVLALATMALAQPLVGADTSERASAGTVARAIVLDTSASMQRTAADGTRAIDVARRRAKQLADSSRTSTILETTTPSSNIAGAVAWLETQQSRRELIVLSDFQLGSFDVADVASVPTGIGLQLTPLGTAVVEAPRLSQTQTGDGVVSARTTISPLGTAVEWRTSGARDAVPATAGALELLVGVAGRTAAERARRAGGAPTSSGAVVSGRTIAVVFPTYEQHAALAQRARPVAALWMLRAIERIRLDSTLLAIAARVSGPVRRPAAVGARVLLLRDVNGQSILSAATDSVNGVNRLLLFADFDAESLVSAALVSAGWAAIADAPSLDEFEPERISVDSLRRWSRAPAATSPSAATRAPTDRSDGRWLWLAVLMLLGAEFWLRRVTRGSAASEGIA